jgi:thioredoxin 1
VDVEAEPELAGVLGVQTLPAWMVFRDGFLLLNHVGPVPEPMLEDLVRQARALDMDDVRLEVAEYRARGTPRVRIGLHGV